MGLSHHNMNPHVVTEATGEGDSHCDSIEMSFEQKLLLHLSQELEKKLNSKTSKVFCYFNVAAYISAESFMSIFARKWLLVMQRCLRVWLLFHQYNACIQLLLSYSFINISSLTVTIGNAFWSPIRS